MGVLSFHWIWSSVCRIPVTGWERVRDMVRVRVMVRDRDRVGIEIQWSTAFYLQQSLVGSVHVKLPVNEFNSVSCVIPRLTGIVNRYALCIHTLQLYADVIWSLFETVKMMGTVCCMWICYSYPLINMPLPGNAPLQFVTPVEGYKLPPALSLNDFRETTDGDLKLPRWVSMCHYCPLSQILSLLVLSGSFNLHSVCVMNTDAVHQSVDFHKVAKLKFFHVSIFCALLEASFIHETSFMFLGLNYLSHCYSIAWDHLCDLCVCVCLSVCPCSHGRNFARISTKFGTDVRILKRKNPFFGGQNPLTVSPVLPNFTPNWHPRNAFSMGDLIISVHSSNNVSWRPPTPECENRVKGGVARVMWPRKFWGVTVKSC